MRELDPNRGHETRADHFAEGGTLDRTEARTVELGKRLEQTTRQAAKVRAVSRIPLAANIAPSARASVVRPQQRDVDSNIAARS